MEVHRYLRFLDLDIRNTSDKSTISLDNLYQDINEGFHGTTRNYIRPYWSSTREGGATSIELEIDEDCIDNTQDITQNSLFHCDCRYLNVHTSPNYSAPLITNLTFSREELSGRWNCTKNINMERRNVEPLPLYLCWTTESGTIFSLTRNTM